MRISINDRDVPMAAPAGATVGEIVEAAKVHVDPDEIVVAVHLDDAVHAVGDDERFLRRPAAGLQAIGLDTQSPRALAADKRRSLADAATVIAAKIRRVAGLLRAPDERAGNGLLAAVMEELRLGLLLEQQLATLDGTAPHRAQQAIRGLAPELLAAQERRAWAALADLLDGRLAPILDAWAADL
jgi:hypothetical protein